MKHENHLGQPIGFPLSGWQERPAPPREPMSGRFVRLEPLDVGHARDLYDANALDREGRNWTYLAYGPYAAFEPYREWVAGMAASQDPLFHTIVDLASGKAVGVASYLRIDPKGGVIEVGHINYSPLLQKKPGATEAMFLMMQRAFDELGYRRYEWKCDSLNAPSRRAAERLGFVYESIFRQAAVYKNRNRDTAWYSIVDGEWPTLKTAYQAWLDPANFTADGAQVKSLSALIAGARGG